MKMDHGGRFTAASRAATSAGSPLSFLTLGMFYVGAQGLLAIAVYWVNLLLLGLLLACLRYARKARLFDPERTDAFQRAFERRIIIPQCLHVVAFAVSAINTYVSIALFVLLQLNSAIAPDIRPLNRF